MYYYFEFHVTVPQSLPPEQFQALRDEERKVVHALQEAGEIRHLWRVAGQFASMGIFDVTDHDRLHAVISGLPLFPYMSVRLTPLARHQAARDPTSDA